jgi:raffinose/stachyose/melibiose transport system substrate-binding protein
MKKSSHKVLALLISALMLLGMLSACSPSSQNQGTPANPSGDSNASAETQKEAETSTGSVTLTILANQDWVSKPYMKAAWQNYEQQTGNKLDIQAVPIDSGEQIMKTKFATGEIPDIFMHFPGHGLAPYRPADNFVEFSDAPWVSDLMPYVVDQAKYDGKVYGLPHWEASISGMIYNKEIFNDLGITVPTTQAEFVVVIYIFAQRYIISGMTTGAVKG